MEGKGKGEINLKRGDEEVRGKGNKERETNRKVKRKKEEYE